MALLVYNLLLENKVILGKISSRLYFTYSFLLSTITSRV